MPRSKRALASLASLTVLAAAGAAVTLAAPAQAASSTGGTITRGEVIARAQSWVDQGVPYNQGAYHSDSNGSYREDCSGYVSMAWHLGSSLTTWTLPDVSTKISFSQLKPGDAMDYTDAHTFLFAGWTNQSTGAFTYYAESNSNNPTHGPTSANINSSSLEGWPTSYYDALRYDNIVDDAAPAPVMARTVGGDFNGDGKQDIAGIDASSNMKLYTGDGAGTVGGGSDMLGSTGLWKGFKAIASGDFNGDGKSDIAGIDANDNLKLYTGDGAGHLGGGTNMLGSTGLWKGFKAITAADFNGDGKQDIAGIDANDNLKLYTGDGTGAVGGGTNMLGSTGLWKGFNAITAADFNSDGKQDIAGIDANDNLKLYVGNGTGTVSGGTNMLGSTGLWKGFRSLLAADYNADGKQDIAGIDANNNMKLYTGNGAGTVGGGTNMLGSTGLWSGF
ncbi:VCBS repeat-containing protein [Streptomyces sp. NPDC046161]|uniref:FG-GAP repeat domain-containing protein n=1 Tax=Streptomyces sp. NPDC046161 TaxID=3155132 RepID=UPI0033D7B8F0